jgi:DNA mismatch endonuclease (patch repair protein)
MADIYSREKRSELMSRVRSSGNRKTELRMIQMFRKYGIRGWRRNWPVFGKPDFVFPMMKVAVFVDGCFWHRCPLHSTVPETNHEFWQRKLEGNILRDRLVRRSLTNLGWRVLRVWQHELKEPERVAKRVCRALQMELNSGVDDTLFTMTATKT